MRITTFKTQNPHETGYLNQANLAALSGLARRTSHLLGVIPDCAVPSQERQFRALLGLWLELYFSIHFGKLDEMENLAIHSV
jgi:hypothetical protein